MNRNKLTLFLTLLLCVFSLKTYALGLQLGLGFTAPVVVDGGSVPALPEAHLFLSIGNSHDIGRDDALGGDIFPAKVWQWTQGGIFTQPVAAQLDHVDENSDEYAVDISFTQDYLAANPSINRLVMVPNADRSTGMVSGHWSFQPSDHPNLLTDSVVRYNAAYAQLVSDGFAVTTAGVFYHNANPDYSDSDYDTHREDIDGLIAYLRANLIGGADIAIVIGGGMNNQQFSGRTTNDALFQANLLGVEYRNIGVASYDTINPRYGYSDNLPVANKAGDGIHSDRAGDITKGHLRYNSLLRAAVNAEPNAPFSNLASWAGWDAFIDFRSGTGRDMTGNGNHLIRNGVPLIRFEGITQQLVFDRPSGSSRYYRAGSTTGVSYTKSVFIKFDTLDTQGLMQDSDNGTRFFLTSSGNELRAYHTSSSDRVDFPRGDLATGQYYLITVTYDSASTTMKIYLDGVLKDTNTSVGAHSLSGGEYIGAQNGSGAGKMEADMAFVGYRSTVMTLTEIQDLNTAAQSLIVP